MLEAPPTTPSTPTEESESVPTRRRGSRRPRSEAAPPRRKGPLQLPLVIALSVGGILTVIGGASLMETHQHKPPLRFNAPVAAAPFWLNDFPEEKPDVLAKQNLRDAGPFGPEIKPIFAKLAKALGDLDAERATALFGCGRRFDELRRQRLVPSWLLADRATDAPMIRDSLGRWLVQMAKVLDWHDTEIRSVMRGDRDEAVVIARHRYGPDNLVMRVRWWLVRSGGAWKIYDFEDFDMNFRASFTMASVMQDFDRNGAMNATAVVWHLCDAQVAVNEHNFDRAEAVLRPLAGRALPPLAESQRLLVEGVVLHNRNQSKAALDKLDRAAQLNPDLLGLDLTRGICHCMLGDWAAAALKHLDAYHTAMGDDSLVCYERGEALRGLSRFKEAAESYRVALRYNPKDANSLLGLIRAMDPGESRDELGERFAKLGEPGPPGLAGGVPRAGEPRPLQPRRESIPHETARPEAPRRSAVDAPRSRPAGRRRSPCAGGECVRCGRWQGARRGDAAQLPARPRVRPLPHRPRSAGLRAVGACPGGSSSSSPLWSPPTARRPRTPLPWRRGSWICSGSARTTRAS